MKLPNRFYFLLLLIGLVTLAGVFSTSTRSNNESPSISDAQRALYQEKLAEIGRDLVSNRSTVGFSKLGTFYEENLWFRPYCHEFALALGANVYQQQKDPDKLVLGPESVLCNYGFYQEYPRAFLLDGGSVDRAAQFCIATGKALSEKIPDVEAECFRGIGRALPFIGEDFSGDQKRMATYAVAQCKLISPNTADYENCLSGLFNKLGRETISASSYTEEPLSLCNAFEPDVRARCIGNYKWAALSLAGITNYSQLLTALHATYRKGVSTATLEAVTWSFGYDMARLHVAEFKYRSDIETCAEMPGPLAAVCISGYTVGLAKHGIPNKQHEAVLQFCTEALAIIPALSNDDCPAKSALSYLEGFYPPHEREAMCRTFEESLGVQCK